MTELKATEGPYTVSKGKLVRIQAHRGGKTRVIAGVHRLGQRSRPVQPGDPFDSEHETIATAHLLKASWKLYHACMAALRAATGDMDPEEVNLVEMLRNATREARGEE